MTNSTSRKDYIKELKKQYGKARLARNKKRKTELLNEGVSFTGMHRKYLNALLVDRRRKYPPVFARGGKRGRRPLYDNADFMRALLACWRATNQTCAENLQPYLPELVPRLERCGELRVSPEVRRLLLRASISTVARKLRAHRTKDRVPLGVSTTRPGLTLRSQVTIRKGRWQETKPGYLETDTVAHCGEINVGSYVHSYNFVDIATSWSEQTAAMGMGERATVAALKDARERFPFAIRGIDSDNGSEFLNNHLYRYCRDEKLSFTRSRPYHKNDNAHVEQKNNSAIRKVVGYARYDTQEQLAILNQLYSGPLRLYLNFCQPTRKRKTKLIDTKTGKVRKTFFEAKTPYHRIMESGTVDDNSKQLLQSQYNNLNPVKLLAAIRALLDELEKTLR
jgi:hypothetical protein